MLTRLAALCAAFAGLILISPPVMAAPRAYLLEPAESSVAFETDFGADLISGVMPVAEATIAIDFADLSGSSIEVQLDAGAARASFPFATQAMTGPRVLDTASHPMIRFQSQSVTRAASGADVDGMITVRGQTRPIRLHAEIYRQQDTAEGDLTALVVLLTGALRRSDFGADGWSDLVGDEVRLTISASLVAAD
jgi:polyisoprenoid-binding protein YceI